MQQLGDLPEEGLRILLPAFDAVVKKMNGPRIVMARIFPKAESTAECPAGS